MSAPTMTINEWLRASVPSQKRANYRNEIVRHLLAGSGRAKPPGCTFATIAAEWQWAESTIEGAYLFTFFLEGDCAFDRETPRNANPYVGRIGKEWDEGWLSARELWLKDDYLDRLPAPADAMEAA